jgi:hypothetical protein
MTTTKAICTRLLGALLGMAGIHLLSAADLRAQTSPPSPCHAFFEATQWKGTFTLQGTGSGSLADGGTYSINETVTAGPFLSPGNIPGIWGGALNETIHIAGSALTFVLDLTTNVVSPDPDQFSFAIVDPNGNPIPTSDPTGFDNLVIINLDSTTPTTNIYSDLVSVTSPTATPEPSSLLLLASGLFGLSVARHRFKARCA